MTDAKINLHVVRWEDGSVDGSVQCGIDDLEEVTRLMKQLFPKGDFK